jgi:ribosomal protein S18 acetylase RimI-like enzyme
VIPGTPDHTVETVPIPISYRAARPADSSDIARFMCMSGGGLYEFLFDDLIPFVTAQDILSAGIAGEDYPISYRNCRVATVGEEGAIVGAANVFPVDLLKDESYLLVASERHNHIRPMLELQDWGSMFLNSLATDETYRGGGIGGQLLAWAKERTAAEGFDSLSLHVWADNTDAVSFYEARGFARVGLAKIAHHSRLAHNGGSLLMSWKGR